MLQLKAIVRVSPPPILQLLQVAAGRVDVFWQYSGERAGLLAGALMSNEAEGTVTHSTGHRGHWQAPTSAPPPRAFTPKRSTSCPRSYEHVFRTSMSPLTSRHPAKGEFR